MWRLIIAAVLLGAAPVQAKPPEGADPALAPWFRSLRQPSTGIPCCSVTDCRLADWRINNDRYEAFIDGVWRDVPPDHVIRRDDNPTGRAVACWTPVHGVLCFVKGPDT
jgi:hypothetical protein